MSSSSNGCSTSPANRKLLPISQIADFYPEAISDSLQSLNIKGCRLSGTSYCTQDACVFNQPPNFSIPITCSCSIYTILANMYLGMYQSIFCVITNQSSTVYNIVDQEVVINIVNDDGQSMENVDISVNQTASVQIVSLSSQTVQSDLSTLSYQSIENVLLQAKQNPTYFSDPVSKQILKAFEMYGSENLNTFIKEEITASLQSITNQNQSIILTIKDSTWKKLSISFTQEDLVTIMAKNIVTVTMASMLPTVLSKYMKLIQTEIKTKYCYTPSKAYYFLLFIFLLLIPIYYVANSVKEKRFQQNITYNINT